MSKQKRASCQQRILTKRRKAQQGTITRKSTGQPNWIDLPRDVMFLIFAKLGILEILRSAEKVCSLWRTLAKEPVIYRSLEISHVAAYFLFHRRIHLQKKFEYVAKEAVNRSCGQLVKWSSGNMVTRDLLLYVNLSNSNTLRSLRFGPETSLSGCDLVEVVKHLHSLEELELWFGYFPKMMIEQVGRSCPKLTNFWLCQDMNFLSFDKEASCIVRNMPQLRYLGLVGSELTSKGLQTILEGCAHLECLDLRHSSGVDVGKNMYERCVAKIGNVLLPDESSFGCEAISEDIGGVLVWKKKPTKSIMIVASNMGGWSNRRLVKTWKV